MTDNSDLDALLRDARDMRAGDDLTARVMHDAQAVQEQLKRQPLVATPPRKSWWPKAVEAMGGWSAVSGITAAGVMGLAVGLYSPDTVSAWLEGDVSLGTYELAPDVGGLWTEDGDV